MSQFPLTKVTNNMKTTRCGCGYTGKFHYLLEPTCALFRYCKRKGCYCGAFNKNQKEWAADV